MITVTLSKFNSEFTPEKWWDWKTIRLPFGSPNFRGELLNFHGVWDFHIHPVNLSFTTGFDDDFCARRKLLKPMQQPTEMQGIGPVTWIFEQLPFCPKKTLQLHVRRFGPTIFFGPNLGKFGKTVGSTLHPGWLVTRMIFLGDRESQLHL